LKHLVRIAASFALSAFFLWIAVRDVSLAETGAVLREAHLVYVAPICLVGILSLYLRALRWGVLLAPLARIDSRSLFSATAIGFAANMLLPLRAGEVLRPWFLARKHGLSLPQTIATVAIERLFDMATLLLFFGVATLTLPLPPEWRRYGWVFLATFMAFLALLIALQRGPERTIALLSVVLGILPARLSEALLGIVRQFADGLASLRSGSAIGLAVVYSMAIWTTLALSFGFGLSALDLPVPWVRGALSLTAIVAIAVAIPGGPGFIGMFQVGCEVGLGVYGIGKSVAFSYSVLVHVLQFSSTVVVGLYFFLKENLSLREIREAEVPASAGDHG
jgi:uncharacterized protein (TIRG00374 family)